METLGYLFLLGIIIFLGIRFLVAHSKEIGRFFGKFFWIIGALGVCVLLVILDYIPWAIGVGILAIALYPFRKKD